MKTELLSQLLANARTELESLKKNKKSMEMAIMRVQPLLNKYVTEGHAKHDTEFKVCVLGPSCCKRGGIELLADMKEMAKAMPEAKITESECLRRCGRGPNVEVGGIVYTGMNHERAKELMTSQLSKKALNVDLLLNDEFAGEAIRAEEQRCNFDLDIQRAKESFHSLEAQINAVANNLPGDPMKKVLAEVMLMQAMQVHGELAVALNEAEALHKTIVPMEVFVTKAFALQLEKWRNEN